MQFTSALAAVAALAFAESAAAAPANKVAARIDPHELDFRTFGTSGCFAENQGVYTLELSDANVCNNFVDVVGSLNVTDNQCTLTLYQDAACSVGPVVAPVGICQNGNWQSYKMTC